MVQLSLALACLLAGADAFAPIPTKVPHHTHEEPDTHEVPHHTHESESPPPSASPSPAPSAPVVIVPKFKEHQGSCTTSEDNRGPVAKDLYSNADDCWNACEKEAAGEKITTAVPEVDCDVSASSEEIRETDCNARSCCQFNAAAMVCEVKDGSCSAAGVTTKAASTHVFRVLEDQTTECQCQMGCNCWNAPGDAGIAPGSTTLAKPDWAPPDELPCIQPKFSTHQGWFGECADESTQKASLNIDTAEKCWDTCTNKYTYMETPSHKFGPVTTVEDGVEVKKMECRCSNECKCYNDASDYVGTVSETTPPTITLAKLDFIPPDDAGAPECVA